MPWEASSHAMACAVPSLFVYCVQTCPLRAFFKRVQALRATAAASLCLRAFHAPVQMRAAYSELYRMQIDRPRARWWCKRCEKVSSLTHAQGPLPHATAKGEQCRRMHTRYIQRPVPHPTATRRILARGCLLQAASGARLPSRHPRLCTRRTGKRHCCRATWEEGGG